MKKISFGLFLILVYNTSYGQTGVINAPKKPVEVENKVITHTPASYSDIRDPNFYYDPQQMGGSNDVFIWRTAPGKSVELHFRPGTPYANSGTPRYRGFTPGDNPVSYFQLATGFYSYTAGGNIQHIDSLPATRINDRLAQAEVRLRDLPRVAEPGDKNKEKSDQLSKNNSDENDHNDVQTANVVEQDNKYILTLLTDKSKHVVFRPIPKSGDTLMYNNYIKSIILNQGGWGEFSTDKQGKKIVQFYAFTGEGNKVAMDSMPFEYFEKMFYKPK